MHEGLGGVFAAGAAVASVVKEEDVEAGVVEGAGGGESVADGAVAAVEEEDGGVGGEVGGYPPAV